jgi:hypothetical protein
MSISRTSLCGGFADQRAVVAAHVVDDGFVEAIATDADRLRINDAVQRNDRDFGGTAADVQDHGAARLMHRNTGADGRCHGLLDEEDVAGACALGRFLDRAAFHLGGAAGHADQHARARAEHARAVHLLDEVLQHRFGHGEVGDDAVLHRAHRGDIARGTTQHALGVGTDGGNSARAARATILADRDDRRFIEDDSLAAHINERVGRAEIDGNVVRKETAELLKHDAADAISKKKLACESRLASSPTQGRRS